MNLDNDGINGRRKFLLTNALLILALTVGGLMSTPAAAQSLNDLRASGAVGEGYDGFVHPRMASGAAQSVAASVNAKRSQIYAMRAKEQGLSPNQVARVYAREIFGKAAKGTWFIDESGTWQQK